MYLLPTIYINGMLSVGSSYSPVTLLAPPAAAPSLHGAGMEEVVTPYRWSESLGAPIFGFLEPLIQNQQY
jgi:hypothetical protein